MRSREAPDHLLVLDQRQGQDDVYRRRGGSHHGLDGPLQYFSKNERLRIFPLELSICVRSFHYSPSWHFSVAVGATQREDQILLCQRWISCVGCRRTIQDPIIILLLGDDRGGHGHERAPEHGDQEPRGRDREEPGRSGQGYGPPPEGARRVRTTSQS